MSTDFDRFRETLAEKVFDQLKTILPEFNFSEGYNGEWISGNKLKVSGGEGTQSGKVYVYRDHPYFLKDYREGGAAITTYLQDRGRANSYFEALKYLADKVGLSIPQGDITDERRAELEEASLKARIFEAANTFFMESLLDTECETAISHKEYLINRGYSDVIFEENLTDKGRLEVGFIPSLISTREALKGKGYREEVVLKCFPDQGYVGSDNRLALPYRDHKGVIQGFAYRDIYHDDQSKNPKYVYTQGLKRSEMLLGLERGRKEIVIVEGIIDALYCQAIGLRNVVALGGTSINEAQVSLAKKLGVERITLCLDNDEVGQKATDRAIDVILKTGEDLKVYVSTLPEGYKDPDELLRSDGGVKAFDNVIKKALIHLNYSLIKRLYEGLEASSVSECPEPLTDIEREKLITDAIKIGSRAKSPVEFELYKTDLNKILAPFGIPETIVGDVLGKAQAEREREKRKTEYKTKLDLAQAHFNNGRDQEALDIICKLGKQDNLLSPEKSYSSLLKPITENEVAEKLKNKPDSIDTGYLLKNDKEDERLLLPSGAITILAAPTNHGKTTLLINLALNVAQKDDQKPVYLFSYEEDREAILLKTLNTYANILVSSNNRRTITSYFKTGSTDYFTRGTEEQFKTKKDSFFKNLIDTKRLSIHYVDYTVEELVGAIKYLKSQDAIGSVFVDYMQLLKVKDYRGNSRVEELKEICLKLKDCAVETGLPIVLAAQFNREVINSDKVHASQIGEAGDIERIANLIIGFWNRTKQELDGKDRPDNTKKTKDEIYATVLKSRDSATGAKADFLFNGNTGKIENRNKNETERQLPSVKLGLKNKKPNKDFTSKEED
jgi:DNA primase catalytic core